MAGVKVRLAEPNDAERIAALLTELGYPNAAASGRPRLAALSKGELDWVLVAAGQGEVVGVAHLHAADLLHRPGRTGRIMAMVVANGWRRRGVGRKLVDTLECIARRAGCVRAEVTSRAARTDAHAFYTALGYVHTPKRFLKPLHGEQP